MIATVRRRIGRTVVAAVAIAVTLALAGCGGIPTSGSVTTGGKISDDANLNIGYRPFGPTEGASQEDIMLGFIQAAVSADDDYAIARKFLSAGFSNKWKPNSVTQIRTGGGSTARESATSLNYTISSSAFVDSTGQYSEVAPATQALSFDFSRDSNNQWRISNAPPGIVLSQESFDTTFEEHDLYYFDPSNLFLVPDVRWFPKTSLISTRVVSALLGGQANWLQQGVTHTEFPTGTALGSSVNIESGTATVDLTEEALSASPTQRELMRQQLANSLGSLGVSTVTITVNGVAIDVSGSSAGKATIDPQVNSALFIRRDANLGWLASDNSVTGIPKLTDKIVKLDPASVTLDRTRSAAAFLARRGVYVARTSDTLPRLLDPRAGLIAPSIDPFGFVWSVPSNNASGLRVFGFAGDQHALSTALPDSASVVSFALSRDGTRALFLFATNVGPQLIVYGIIRQDGVPVALGDANSLTLSVSQPLGATWVDDKTVAVIARDNSSSPVTVFEIGGESTSLGRVVDGAAIVGGNGGTDGLRVVTSAGEIFRPRGTGWQDTAVKVSFVATQQ